MKLTHRDMRLIRDVALSHVLSRDQLLELGYFGSATRLNARLRELRKEGYVVVCATPFFGQHLYMAGRRAPKIVGERIASILSGRNPSPRFIQHALATTSTRIALVDAGCTEWRFETQLRHSFSYGGRFLEIRPDGMVRRDGRLTVLEIDMGHVDPHKYGQKLKGYEAFAESGELKRVWGEDHLDVLTVSVGTLRRIRLTRRAPSNPLNCFSFLTFDDLGVKVAGGWS